MRNARPRLHALQLFVLAVLLGSTFAVTASPARVAAVGTIPDVLPACSLPANPVDRSLDIVAYMKTNNCVWQGGADFYVQGGWHCTPDGNSCSSLDLNDGRWVNAAGASMSANSLVARPGETQTVSLNFTGQHTWVQCVFSDCSVTQTFKPTTSWQNNITYPNSFGSGGWLVRSRRPGEAWGSWDVSTNTGSFPFSLKAQQDCNRPRIFPIQASVSCPFTLTWQSDSYYSSIEWQIGISIPWIALSDSNHVGASTTLAYAPVSVGAQGTPENHPPTATCTGSATGTPGSYQFVASASDVDAGDVLDYVWNYGDSSPTEGGATRTHTYSLPGHRDASVTVTDSHGASVTAQCAVDVPAPTLDLGISLPDKDDHSVLVDEVVKARITVSAGEDGVGDLTNLNFVGDPLRLSPSANLEITDGPSPAIPPNFTLAAGDEVTFDYDVKVLAFGTSTLMTKVAGKDAANRDVSKGDISLSVNAPSMKVTITPSKNDFKLDADEHGKPKPEEITVDVAVKNVTTEAIDNVKIGVLDLAAADPNKTYEPFPAEVFGDNAEAAFGTLGPGETTHVTRHVRVLGDGHMKLLTLVTSDTSSSQGEGKLNTDVKMLLQMTIDGDSVRQVHAGGPVGFRGHFKNVSNESKVAVTDAMKVRFEGNLLGSGLLLTQPETEDDIPLPVIKKLDPGEEVAFEVNFYTEIPTIADYDHGTASLPAWTHGVVNFSVWIRAAVEEDDGTWQALSTEDPCACQYPESVVVEGGDFGAFDVEIDTTEPTSPGGEVGTTLFGLSAGALEGAQNRLSGLWNFAALAFGVTVSEMTSAVGFEYTPQYVDDAMNKELIKGRLKDSLDYLSEVAVWLPAADTDEITDVVGSKLAAAYAAFTETVTGGIPHPEDTRTGVALTHIANDYVDHLQGAWHRSNPNELIEAVEPIGGFVGEQATDALVGEVVFEGLVAMMRTERVAAAAAHNVAQVDTVAELQDKLPSLAQQAVLLDAAERSKSNYEMLETAFQTRTELDLTKLGGDAGLSADTIDAAKRWTEANPDKMIVLKPNEPRAAALRDAGLAVGKGELIKPKSMATIEYEIFGGRTADDLNTVLLRDLNDWTADEVNAKVDELVAAGTLVEDDRAVAIQIWTKRNKEWKLFNDRGLKRPDGTVGPDPGGIGKLKAYDEAGKIPNQFQGTTNQIDFTGPQANLDFKLEYYKGDELLPPNRINEADYVRLLQENPKTGRLVPIVGDDDGIFIGLANGLSLVGNDLASAMRSIYEAFEHPFSDSWLAHIGREVRAKLEIFTPHMEVIPGTTDAGAPAVAMLNGKAYAVKVDGNLSRFDPLNNRAYIKWIGLPEKTTRAAVGSWVEVLQRAVPNLPWPASFLRGLLHIPNAATNPDVPPINGNRNAPVLRVNQSGHVESWTPALGWHLDAAAEAAILAGTINVAPQTQVFGSTEPGATEVQIASQSEVGLVGNWFHVGDEIVLNPGGPNQETAKITSFGSLILAKPLQFHHDSGEVISFVPADTPVTDPPPPTEPPADSAYGMKQSGLATLNGIPSSTNAKFNNRLTKAAGRVTASLAQWRWQGYDALHPLFGRQVFNTERKAVQVLAGKIFRGNTTVVDVTETLLGADRRLVENAIAANHNAGQVAIATRRTARADALITAGNYARAINAFKRAWLAVT